MSEPVVTITQAGTGEPAAVGKSEWDLLAEIRDLLAAILAALKPPRDTA